MELDWTYLHVVLNPFPVVLSVVGVLVGLAGWALGRDGLERYGVLSILLAGAFSLPAYFTGLTAADVAEQRLFVEPSLIQTHRAWATWGTVAVVTAAVFAGFSMTQPGDARLRRFVLLAGLVAAALLGYAAFLGGFVSHGEEAAAGLGLLLVARWTFPALSNLSPGGLPDFARWPFGPDRTKPE